MLTMVTRRALLAVHAVVAIVCLSSPQASAAAIPADTSRCDVATLAGLASNDFVIVDHAQTGPSPVTKPQLVVESAKLEASPAPHCSVAGHIHTANPHDPAENGDVPYHQKEIQLNLALPTDWNNRFLMVGCGALCGVQTFDTRTVDVGSVLSRGYAMASTDTGHTGGPCMAAGPAISTAARTSTGSSTTATGRSIWRPLPPSSSSATTTKPTQLCPTSQVDRTGDAKR